MSRFDTFYYMALLALAAVGCSNQIAPIKVGESCERSDDCLGFAYCYRGHCLASPQCNLNGLKESGEECDDGNDDATDACTNHCLIARCGDGIVRTDLHLEHDNFEGCEPTLGDPDFDCGDDCILRPKARRLMATENGTCSLDSPTEMRCWGAFINQVDLGNRLEAAREDGRDLAPILSATPFWFGTALRFRTPMRGFFYTFDGIHNDAWPDEQHQRPTLITPKASPLEYFDYNFWIAIQSESGLLLKGPTQGGTGEPHVFDWLGYVESWVQPAARDFFPSGIGSCFVSNKGVLNCSTDGNDGRRRPRDCDDLYLFDEDQYAFTKTLRGAHTRVRDAEGIIGVARTGYTVCAFNDLGQVGCFGDLTAYRPLAYVEYRGYCNSEIPCEDSSAPICTSDDVGYTVGRCVGCLTDADCGPGICFDYHCYQATDARDFATCESHPFTILDGLTDVVEIVADSSSFAARTRQGEVYRWGRVIVGKSGERMVRSLRALSLVTLPAPATQLAMNASTTCALLDDARVSCWGLHNGTNNLDPAIVGGLPPVAELGRASRGSNHFCARIAPNNAAALSEFYCWGQNDWFQLGDGTREPRDGAVPVTVSFDARPRPLP